MFRVRPSHFSSQSFSLFQSVLPAFPSQTFLFFFGSRLPQVSPSHFPSQTFPFFGSVLPTFPSQSFSIFEPGLPIFWVTLSHFSSHHFPIFSGQSFPHFQVSPSHFLSQTSFLSSSQCPSGFCLFCVPI